MKHKLYRRYVKRSIDIIASLMGLLTLSWLLCILWIIVRITHGKPASQKKRDLRALSERVSGSSCGYESF